MITQTLDSYQIPCHKKTICNNLYTRHIFWSCLTRCANMKWIQRVLWKIQNRHGFVNQWTIWQKLFQIWCIQRHILRCLSPREATGLKASCWQYPCNHMFILSVRKCLIGITNEDKNDQMKWNIILGSSQSTLFNLALIMIYLVSKTLFQIRQGVKSWNCEIKW